MSALTYRWRDGNEEHELRFVHVPGTNGTPYSFGPPNAPRPIHVTGFHIATTTVTQALWRHVMGEHFAPRPEPRQPVDNVSWDELNAPDGFFDRINGGPIRAAVAGTDATLRFRLPSETEWEYAARGGPHWRDNFAFSGSHRADEVAWYGRRWTRAHQLGVQLFGWRIGWHYLGRLGRGIPTRSHEVATKQPNQLGIYDMSGNVWEWCEDRCIDDLNHVPADGTPWLGDSDSRRLRGGCHHNWDLHCRVWWRYGFPPESRGGAIGFRIVCAPPASR